MTRNFRNSPTAPETQGEMTMTISKLRNALCLCLLGANLALPLPASAQTAAPTANSIAERLQSLYPATRFGAVNTTPWPGVFEVVMGANLAYVDESGQYFLFGHLFDMKAQRDLTAERKDAQTRVDFAALPLADAVKDVRGNGARTLAIFSDPDCPYCLKLETEIKSLTDVTIYTFLMPIASLHPGARSKAIAVWCSRDRVAAWRALMLRDETSPARECPHPVDRNIALGERLGISGTPTLVAARRSHSSRCRQQCADRGVARARHGQRRRPGDRQRAPRDESYRPGAAAAYGPDACRLRIDPVRRRRRGRLRLQGSGRRDVHLRLRYLCEFGSGHAQASEAVRAEAAAGRTCRLRRDAHGTRQGRRRVEFAAIEPATPAAVDRPLGRRGRRSARTGTGACRRR
jgi:thiol:disulfide interchange protein DsbC